MYKGTLYGMKYVIYGAGFRGKNLCNYIGTDNILAFIDLNEEKQGKEYCGKPVISINQYIETYFKYFIIITPAFCNNIENILEKNNIYQYSNLKSMPVEFAGYGNCEFERSYGGLKQDYDKPFCLYGLNAFSLLMYDYFSRDNDISICPENGYSLKKIEWIKKYYPEIKLIKHEEVSICETILSTVGSVEVQFVNKTVNLFEYSNNNKYYWNEELGRFKNLYREKKKCFIVATGPSLCIEDLYTLEKNNIFCFSMNSILKIANKWVADAYVATDLNFVSNNVKDIEDYNCKYKFILNSCQTYWHKNQKNSYGIHPVTSGIFGSEPVGFSEEICQKIYAGTTVTYACIQLAVYMGFTEIYLIGVDCNYQKGSKNNHFIEEDIEDNRDHHIDYMLEAYKYAKDYADIHGIKIYNATRGGHLEIFKRVDMDLLFVKEKEQNYDRKVKMESNRSY